MGEAKRRKQLDPNYGKPELSNLLPDFGELLYKQIGEKAVKVRLFDYEANQVRVMFFLEGSWVISFVTRQFSVKPCILITSPSIATIELGNSTQSEAFSIADKLKEGLWLRARFDKRYFAFRTKERVVPLEVVAPQ